MKIQLNLWQFRLNSDLAILSGWVCDSKFSKGVMYINIVWVSLNNLDLFRETGKQLHWNAILQDKDGNTGEWLLLFVVHETRDKLYQKDRKIGEISANILEMKPSLVQHRINVPFYELHAWKIHASGIFFKIRPSAFYWLSASAKHTLPSKTHCWFTVLANCTKQTEAHTQAPGTTGIVLPQNDETVHTSEDGAQDMGDELH